MTLHSFPTGELLIPLQRHLDEWTEAGNPRRLLKWLDREVGPEGLPRHLRVEQWWPFLATIQSAHDRRPEGWPAAIDARLEPWVRAALRFSRPDGSAIFGPEVVPADRARVLHALTGRLSDPGLETVARWWFPSRRPRTSLAAAPPPLPAFSAGRVPLAVLRSNWRRDGDLLAIDHRRGPTRLELLGAGRRWIGPQWTTAPDAGPARLVRWMSTPEADLAEWAYREGPHRVIRSAILLRGRRLAILAEGRESTRGPASARIELDLPPVVEARMIPGIPQARLSRRGGVADLVAAGLLGPDDLTPADSVRISGPSLIVEGPGNGRRSWLPLVISWDPRRSRKAPRGRRLTVTQRGRHCAPDVAFASRLAWGRADDALILYRSLAPPAQRCFLGHATTARLLIARFTKRGDLVPLLTVED